ncbi:MAG TPA: SUMF1/EgtB/PvdO family nonheme iron enzyme [Solirubrobacterales bacterium]|nr:SUMF1/EgtB/PvdO family nonheme iron enzyme [Solirubrobacterales bacterium]
MRIAVSFEPSIKDRIAERLAEARERTLELVAPLDEEQLNRAYSDLLSPLAWDLGHIANFEELWLVQKIGGREPLDGELGRFYDAIENPRATRNELPLLRGSELRGYMGEVRERALEVLERVELDGSDPLLAGGFAYEMLIAHERQHQETMLQLLQMVADYPCPGLDPAPGAGDPAPGPEMVDVDGGTYEIGASRDRFAYDNERPRHEVGIAPFEIDATPVTNGDFAEHVSETGAEPPLYWRAEGSGEFSDTRFGRREPIDPREPVVHVSAEQARAFARWAGKRLPSELEWEVAAMGSDPDHANLDQRRYRPAPAGSLPSGAADSGALQMLGDVWEWTSSSFRGYPGFRPFPYPEYSEAFFGDEYVVLRGGCWASQRDVIRPTFRNWDFPVRRQIFSGFRCARDRA